MIEHAATKIGLIGLGEQGLRIVQHLEACGFALGVYDKDPDNLANAGTLSLSKRMFCEWLAQSKC